MLKKLKTILWPIENYELRKFLPIAFIKFLMLFNYSILISLKDSFIIPHIGAESANFLSVSGVLPASLLFMMIYMKLGNMMSQEKIFYCIISIFIVFFSLFIFILHPNAYIPHPNPDDIKEYISKLPRLKWFILIYSKWVYSSFSIFVDLWGSLIIYLLFWQFSNQVISTNQAKRFYVMFGFIGNLAGIFAGQIILSITRKSLEFQYFEKSTVPFMINIIIIISLCIIAIYRWLHVYMLTKPIFYEKKYKISMLNSFKLIFTSKYLGLIALLIICCNTSITIVEAFWKVKLRQLYSTSEQYMNFMGMFYTYKSFISMAFFIVAANILRKFSWRVAAIIPPIIILILSLLFFTFFITSNQFYDSDEKIFGYNSLLVAVIFGTLLSIFSRLFKYSLFDATKEMAYIPLDPELKTKGKAAADLVGSGIGKSSGGVILSLIITINPIGGFIGNLSYIITVFLSIISVWIIAVNALAREYLNKIK